MVRIVKGLGSLAVLVFALVGVPALLWLFGGNPIPTEMPSLSLLTQRTDIGVFLSVLTVIGWVAWASLAWAILAELVAVARGVTLSPPKVMAWQHGSARSLVKGVMLLGVIGAPMTGTAIAGADVTETSTPVMTATTVDATEQGHSVEHRYVPAAATAPATSPPAEMITVAAGDTLWDLAETHLGDPYRWTEIKEANPDLTDDVFLPVGAELTLPASAAPSPGKGEIVVVAGDTLWDLAETHLGDPYRWSEIRDANPDRVGGNGGLIQIGDILTLPDATPSDQGPVDTPAVDAPTDTEADTPGEAGESTAVDAPLAPGGDEEPDQGSDELDEPTTADESPSETESDQQVEAPTRDQGPADTPAPDVGEDTSDTDPAPEAATETDEPVAESEAPHADADDDSDADSSTEDPGADSTDVATPERESQPDLETHDDPVPEPEPSAAPAEAPDAEAQGSEEPADIEQQVEDQVAEILGTTDAEDDGSPDPAPAVPYSAPVPDPAPAPDPGPPDGGTPPSDQGPADTPAADAPTDTGADTPSEAGESGAADAPPADTAGSESTPFGSTDVDPQPEAAPGSDEARDIATDAAAVAASALGMEPAHDAGGSTGAGQHPLDDTSTTTVASDIDTDSTADRATLIAGLSAVALLGLISILQWRRRRQQHDRDRGEAIAWPDESGAEVMDSANAAADPVQLADVDRVLRHLDDATAARTTPPRVIGVTITPDRMIDVAVADTIDLPEPWHLVDGAWRVDPRRLPETPHSMVSPWPSLVPIGDTTEDASFLLNLEDVGHLAITGPGPLTLDAIRAMAVELAVSPFGDADMHIHLVGVASDLPDAIDNSRLDYTENIDELLDTLEQVSSEHDDALNDDAIASTAEARRTYPSSDFTAPHIILSALELTDRQRDRLTTLTTRPRFAAAAVTSATDSPDVGWMLEVTDTSSARLRTAGSDGLALRPKALSTADLEAVIDVLSAAQAPATPTDDGLGFDDESVTALHEPDGQEWTAAAVDSTVATDAPSVLPGELAEDPTPDSETVSSIPAVIAGTTDPDPGIADPSPAGTGHVWLHLLGEPRLTPLDPGSVDTPKMPRLIELATMLHLEGDLSAQQIDARFWPVDPHDKIDDPSEQAKKKKNRRQELFSRLRRWLGRTSDGTEAFPKIGGPRSSTPYHLDESVTSDWQIWCDLVPRHAFQADTTDLAQAMSFVRGVPLTRPGIRGHSYQWADAHRQHMVSRMTDAAEELAARYIRDGHTTEALTIAQQGLSVCTAREGLWRMAIIASTAVGGDDGRQRTQELINQMLAEMAELDVELEDETHTLLAQLTQVYDDDGSRAYDIPVAS